MTVLAEKSMDTARQASSTSRSAEKVHVGLALPLAPTSFASPAMVASPILIVKRRDWPSCVHDTALALPNCHCGEAATGFNVQRSSPANCRRSRPSTPMVTAVASGLAAASAAWAGQRTTAAIRQHTHVSSAGLIGNELYLYGLNYALARPKLPYTFIFMRQHTSALGQQSERIGYKQTLISTCENGNFGCRQRYNQPPQTLKVE